LVPKVSIIIPCFNQGHFLPDALSNLDAFHTFYEVIIINDGSTDADTIEAFSKFKELNFRIIDQENKGLAGARNTGIALAKGEYIVLLDADNVIDLDFVNKAVTIFENDYTTAVVYSDAEYFGNKTGRWVVGEFNLQRLMIANYIDACAIIRKSVFEDLGGYDIEMKKIKSGWEDWEMWLRIGFSGKKFSYIPVIGFKYRVSPTSMITSIQNSYEVQNRLVAYLHKKYPSQLGHQFITDFVIRRFKPHPFKFIIKLSMIAWFKNWHRKLLDKNKIIAGI